MIKIIKTTIAALVVMIGLSLAVGEAKAAILAIDPPQKEFALGETFLVEVHLNSEQEVINAVEAVINYSVDNLEVVEVSQGGSFLTLWVQEPAVEKTAGVISLVGGVPGGSYVVEGKVVTITFRTKTAGGVEVSFDQEATSVHLNDGLGTAAPLTLVSGIYNVSSATFIAISSPTHPNENAWYKNRTFTVKWDTKAQADYSYILSDNPDEEPDNHSEAEAGKVTFSEVADGVYYFILKERIFGGEWQLVGKRRVMIDNLPPLAFEVEVSRDNTLFDGKYFLIFSTVDKISGIDHYDIKEDQELYGNASSPYVLKDQTQAKAIVVTAFDRAGNSTGFTLAGTSDSDTSSTNINLILIIVGVVLIIIILLVFFSIRSKKNRTSN